MQRAVQMKSPSGEDYLTQLILNPNKRIPKFTENEVLIRLRCRPVNPSDIMTLSGRYVEFTPEKWPITPGLEGMGVVEAVGEAVGQRVVPLVSEKGRQGDGTWQEYITAAAENVVAVPDEVSDGSAAQFFINPWTVVGLLDELDVPRGEYVLQTAASSALGKQFIQYARHQGIKTVNVVRRSGAVEELKKLGADVVVNSEEEDVVAAVREATRGGGVYGAVDPVGGKATKAVASCVRDGGTVLVYGAFAGDEVAVTHRDLLLRDVRLHGFYLFHWIQRKYGTPARRDALAHYIMTLLKEGIIVPRVGKQFDLADVKAAIMEAQQHAGEGKVLLVG